jgi:UDP:flavonoid glycosyltransferase YjiC (YdhE family)
MSSISARKRMRRGWRLHGEARAGTCSRISSRAIRASRRSSPRSRSLTTARLRVVAEPVDLARVLERCDLCICPGGPGVVARAWVAGVPMALLPMQLEQFLVARKAVEAGVATAIAPDAPMADFAEWFATALAHDGLREAARERARAHAGYRFDEAARRVARRIAREAP